MPPLSAEYVACECSSDGKGYGGKVLLFTDTLMFCEKCCGERYFRGNGPSFYINKIFLAYIHFSCKNCNDFEKTFAVKMKMPDEKECEIYKIGEIPPFGPVTPSKFLKLIGEDRDLYLVGRRAESQGMGIGAYTYYRRVLEKQRERIFEEIIKVLVKFDTEEEIVSKFRKAKENTQFSQAIETIKDILPKVLFIDGHNPLTILYAALSEGIHELSDEECLEIATHIRVVLFELAERMNAVLAEKKELKEAVSKLFKPKKKE